MILNGEEVVPQEVLIPRDRWAHNVFDPCGLGDGRQGLIAEHHDENERQRSGKCGQRGQQAVGGPAATDRRGDGAGADQQRCQRYQTLWRQGRTEYRDHDRERGRRQPPGRDGVLDQHPHQQHCEGDQRLGTKAVVERQPGRQEDRASGGDGHPVMGQPAGARPQPGKYSAAQDQPATYGGRGGRQPHPHPGGADRRQLGEHRLIPVERRLGGTEVAVVVGRVAGLAGDPRDGEVVAVVRGDRPDDVPQQQRADDGGIDRPVPKQPPPTAHRSARVATVQHGQCHERGDDAEDADSHRGQLEQGRAGDEPGVDVDARRESRLRRNFQLGEDP